MSDSIPPEKFHDETTPVDSADFTEWLLSDPSMPHQIERHVIETFINWAGNDVKEFAKDYYRARQHYRKLFRNRQPGSKLFERYSSTVVAEFTKPETPEIIVLGPWQTDKDAAKFCPYHQAKLIFNALDILLQENCTADKKIYLILDLANYTDQHLAKITKFTGSVISRLLTSATPTKMEAVYIVNQPPTWVSKYTELYYQLDCRLLPAVEDLLGFLDPQFIPSDLWGAGPPRSELAEQSMARLWHYACWLADEEVKRERELYIYSQHVPEPVKEKPKKGAKGKNKKKKGKK